VVDFLINAVVNPAGAVAGGRVVERTLGRINNRADTLRNSLARTFAFVGIAQGIRSLVGFADTVTNVQNRLRLTTRSVEELTERTQDLFEVSIRTRSSFDSTATLYNRVALSARELGRSQEELVEFTESLNQAIILSGASSIEARNGLIQFSQGVASGALRGDELRSVLEQLPAVADVISAQLGITRGELREFGATGGITAEIILDAFKNAREELGERFAQTIPTVGQAFEVLTTRLIEVTNEFNKSTNFSNRLATALLFLADNAELILRSFIALGTFLATDFAVGAVGKAVTALRILGVALLTNPIFALGTLLAGSIAAIVAFGDQIQVSNAGIANLRDLAVAAFNVISETVTPILVALRVGLEELFQGPIPDIRTFAEAFALTFDQLVGIVEGVILVFADVFGPGLTTLLDGSVAVFDAFFLRVAQIFEELANFIANIFTRPFQTVLEAVQTLLSSIAGAAAVLTQVGILSEESRRDFEGAVNNIEAGLARLRDGSQPVKLFNTEDTKQDIDDALALAERSFEQIGDIIENSFIEGTEGTPITDFVTRIFDEAEIVAADRRAEEARQRERDRQPFDTGGDIFGPRGDGGASLSGDAQKLLEQIDAQAELNRQALIFNEVLNARKDLSEELETAFLAAQIAALEASTAIEDGFTRAFLKLQQEAMDFASAAESAVNSFADRATDAITNFLVTGEGSFKEFATAVLADLTRILVRLLIVRAISAVVGAAGGGGESIAGAATSAASQLGASQIDGRASGGTVQPDRSFIVGEEGPELFVPNRTGTIVPNAASVQQEPPQVNVQVVNVDDENAVPSAIEGGQSDEAILNVLARNKSRVSQVIR